MSSHPAQTRTTPDLDVPAFAILRELAVVERETGTRPNGITVYDRVDDTLATGIGQGYFYDKLADLVTEGLVDRAKDEEDRRSYTYSVSPAGERALITEAEWLATAVGASVDSTGGERDGI